METNIKCKKGKYGTLIKEGIWAHEEISMENCQRYLGWKWVLISLSDGEIDAIVRV